MKHFKTVVLLNSIVYALYVWIQFDLPDLRFWKYTPEERMCLTGYIIFMHMLAYFVRLIYTDIKETKAKNKRDEEHVI